MSTRTTEGGLLRSSANVALGTMASRFTGFVRTAVLAFAVGTHALGDAYNTANAVPPIVYDLLLGGIVTSAIVPLLVRAHRRDADRGYAYEQRLLTLVTMCLLGITVAAVLAAEPLISLYADDFTPAQHDLTVALARFLLPQVFFYGVGAMAAAILNARGHFAAPAWTPVVNNVVVIGVGLTFLAITEPGIGPKTVSSTEATILAIGTTLGIVAQTVALYPALRAAGFAWRPRFDFRAARVGEIARMATWILAYVVTNQVGFAVAINLANAAGVRARAEGVGYGAGFTAYQYAYTLFQLPYAIVAVAVITALLPRMSGHATERRGDLLRDDFSSGLRLSSVLVVPVAAAFLALGPAITVVVFGHLRTSVEDAAYIGQVLRAFAVGMVPFVAFQLQLRIFYSLADTRTPALINAAATLVNVVVDIVAFLVLPARHVVLGLACGFAVSYLVGTVLSGLVLRDRLGGLDGRRVARTVLLLHAAAAPAMILAIAMLLAFVGTFGMNSFTALLAVVLGAGGGGLLYVLVARRLGIREIHALVGAVRGRLSG